MLTYHVITYGCQMNKNDSERIRGVLESLGLEESSQPQGSDVVVLNTCSVRQSAEDRVFGQMRNFEQLKREKQDMVLVITGCMPGRDRDGDGGLRKRLAVADLFFPIKDLIHFPRWLSEVRPDIANTANEVEDYLKIQPSRRTNPFQAFISISSGCDNYCTFCVVPFSRGRMQSRSLLETIQEARDAVKQGAVEATLLGQNVNTYRPMDLDKKSSGNPYHDGLAILLWEMNQLPGLERIHFIAPNPQDMSDEVVDALGLPKQVDYLHLPVQSGSNRVLKKMNRRYTREQYFEIIGKVRMVRPTIALGTDIIVGFCTETEAEFMETIDLYRRVGFDISYNAQYSSRSGTVAGRLWEDDVPREEKKRRWEYLQDVMEEQTLAKNRAYVGKTVEVFVERWQAANRTSLRAYSKSQMAHGTSSDERYAICDRPVGMCFGNSREMKLVEFLGSQDLVGTIVSVRVGEVLTWVLRGILVEH